MEEANHPTSAKASRRRRHHRRGNPHRHHQAGQAASEEVSGAPRPLLIEEPGVEATAKLDGSSLQIGVISTRGYADVMDTLVATCCSELMLKGVESHNLHVAQVALPTELPYTTKQLICSAPEPLDAVIVVGCMVEGASLPCGVVADAVANAIVMTSLETKTPVINGLLYCKTTAQARQCAGLAMKCGSFGVEWAQTAIMMACQNREVETTPP